MCCRIWEQTIRGNYYEIVILFSEVSISPPHPLYLFYFFKNHSLNLNVYSDLILNSIFLIQNPITSEQHINGPGSAGLTDIHLFLLCTLFSRI